MSIGGIPHNSVGPVTVPQCHGTTRRLAKFQKVEMDYTTITACRSCACTKLTYLFTLGDQHVSDFVPKDRIFSGPKVPIELVLCVNCGLVQQLHSAPAEMLYRRYYWYRSGTTETMKSALGDVVKAACALVKPALGDVALDIGSNDGTLLRWYDTYAPGVVKVGIEPAANLLIPGEVGVDFVIDDFWGSYNVRIRYASLLDEKKAKIITACGCFYDLEDPNPFLADVAKVLHPEGVFIAQLMCLKQMLQLGDVGNLCHEHLEFYSLESLTTLFERNGLEIKHVESNNINGGSYRLYAGLKGGKNSFLGRCSVLGGLAGESGIKLKSVETYSSFFQEAVRNRDECLSWLGKQYACGAKIHVYGASTKGNVLLQWYRLAGTWLANNVDTDTHPWIQCAADKSPEKWGMYTVGSGIPIVSDEESRRMRPDIYLVLPYAFKQEFIEREKDFLARGGKLVFPLPRFEVVGQ